MSAQKQSQKLPAIGNQQPRIRRASKAYDSYGDDCSDLAGAYGLTPDPWQRSILNDWLATNRNGKIIHTSCGLSVPRQNGKTAVIEARVVYGLSVLGEKILYSAHEVKTAYKAFHRLCGFFENPRKYPELAAILKKIRKANGQEIIECEWVDDVTGELMQSSIEFSARSKGAARGYSVDLVIYDEAQELTDDQLEAMMSTMSASQSENRQSIFTGTPPYPGCYGTVFKRLRETAIKNLDKKLCWHEWSVTEIGDVSDRERWYDANPAMGIRLDEEFTADEMHTMSPDGFARERLGWWPSEEIIVDHPISREEWEECYTADPANDGIETYGVKFDKTGTAAAISVCVKSKDAAGKDQYYVELCDVQSTNGGFQWIVDFFQNASARVAKIIIDSRMNAYDTAQRISTAGISGRFIINASTKDLQAACSMLTNAVKSAEITHYGQDELDAAATQCVRRNIGKEGAWGFDDNEQGFAFIIESAALAYYEGRRNKRNPKRRQKIG